MHSQGLSIFESWCYLASHTNLVLPHLGYPERNALIIFHRAQLLLSCFHKKQFSEVVTLS
jgi:hypothetical protein